MERKKLYKNMMVATMLAAVLLLSGCASTYHADFSKPKSADERTNPYQQKVPTDGIASFVGEIIRK